VINRQLLRCMILTCLLTGSALASSTASAAAGSQTTRYVDDDGRAGPARGCADTNRALRSIQKAVEAPNRNDIILVCRGVYDRVDIRGRGHDGLILRALGSGVTIVGRNGSAVERSASRASGIVRLEPVTAEIAGTGSG
jgi:hypothetical protein